MLGSQTLLLFLLKSYLKQEAGRHSLWAELIPIGIPPLPASPAPFFVPWQLACDEKGEWFVLFLLWDHVYILDNLSNQNSILLLWVLSTNMDLILFLGYLRWIEWNWENSLWREIDEVPPSALSYSLLSAIPHFVWLRKLSSLRNRPGKECTDLIFSSDRNMRARSTSYPVWTIPTEGRS